MSQKQSVPAWMLFLGGIAALGVSAGIFLVVVSSQNRHVLVRDDYYAAGLKLDEHRAAEAAFDSLGFDLALRAESGALILEAISEDGGVEEQGLRMASYELLLELRRPDDNALDRDLAMTLASDEPPLWVADAPPLRRGRWNARAVLQQNGMPVMERSFIHDAR